MASNIRVLALYLPQYHPIPENDLWWGKGFTEWTNVGKARKLFKGHYQPRVPADLGYYDLRVAETRIAQAEMARRYGIEGFIYWHYWFGNGKRLIERPFNEVLQSGEPDFPFALAWANESWQGFAHGLKNRNMLIEQKYGGIEDYTAHFYEVLPAFRDKRYITVDGKPFFMIYKPMEMADVELFIETWQRLAKENNLKGIHFVGHNNQPKISDEQILAIKGIDAVNPVRLIEYTANRRSNIRKIYDKLYRKIRSRPLTYPYSKVSRYFLSENDARENVYPGVIPDWDHTPRSGKEGLVLSGSTPENFGKLVAKAVKLVEGKEPEHRIIVVKSWNEWAEGNYMEPDLKWGNKYLEALYNQIK